MYCQIIKVKCLEGTKLKLFFEDGSIKVYDMHDLYDELPSFKQLDDRKLFCKAHVEMAGYGVAWNDELDIACKHLYEHGIEAEK